MKQPLLTKRERLARKAYTLITDGGIVAEGQQLDEDSRSYQIADLILTEKAESEKDTIGNIYSLANDLADKDPSALGSVPLSPYMANAITIYSEYLKGDNYERIDWKKLDLPTLKQLEKEKK